jgi:hypothetical protein
VAEATFIAAAIAREMVQRYGVRPKDAAIGAAHESVVVNWREAHDLGRHSVEREFRELGDGIAKVTKARTKYQLALMPQEWIDDAMSRLSAAARWSGWARPADLPAPSREAKPLPPIIYARLFDPVE